MKPKELHERLLQTLLDVAWCQWTAIGVAGGRGCNRVIVDPEALLLATLAIGRYDARLFDEALDWVATNARHLDMARLRRLGKAATADQRRLLGVAADIAVENGAKSSFGELAAAGMAVAEKFAGYGLQPLFITRERGDTDWAGVDQRFEQAGFSRSPLALRAMSGVPRGDSPACVRFRARGLLGSGSRAEVLVYLWTHEWAHGRRIADRSAYNQAPVAEYLLALSELQLVQRRTEGRKSMYRLAEELRQAGGTAPEYVDWVRVWPGLVALLEALRPADLSEDAEWVRLAQALESSRDALGGEGLEIHIPRLDGWARSGPDVLRVAVDEIIGRLTALQV